MDHNKLLYQIALTQIEGVGDITARNLLKVVGDAETIFKSSRKSLLSISGLGHITADHILAPSVMLRAEKELNFVLDNRIETYYINDENYPTRLLDCADAPILLYFRGKANFNTPKVISIVGTRNSSNYGNSFCDTFLEELAQRLPDTLVISGLAYGIDINAHRAALKHKLPTIGVLAHGLDKIYPAAHRATATEMLESGGLLTEFCSQTEPERYNFVRRNRIVAGMADATLVIESNNKGGSLITADIANSYCRDVFALPGRLSDTRSQGCNKIISEHKADLLLSTDYFIQQMGWDEDSEKKKKTATQRELFVELSLDEQKIVDKMSSINGLHVDQIAQQTGIPTHQLFGTLLALEMKGVIASLPGSTYALL